LPQAAYARLGRRVTHTDTSGDFDSGLEFARSVLRTITYDPHWGIVKHVSLHVPCELLRNGGCVVDAPVVDDADIARTRHLCGWMKEATQVVLVLSVAPLSHALRIFLEKSGYLHCVQEDTTKQLTVVIPGDKFIKYMDKDKREDWENRHKKEKLDTLRKSLIKCSRAQEKRNAVTAFIETSGRFKFFHFYR
jgi:hypothetical protein